VYRKLERSWGNVLSYEAWGKLTKEELGAILADMEEAIDSFGKVNLLVYLPEIPRPDLGAIGEDLQFAHKHTKDVDRYAVVGGSALFDLVARLEGPLVGIEIKHFEPDRLDKAWRWLYEVEAGQ
jgi:hypothetical protein